MQALQLPAGFSGRTAACCNRSRQLVPLQGSRHVSAKALKPNQSFGSSDELDLELSNELARLLDPSKADRMKRHYELLWKVQNMKNSVEECTCCQGSGERECDWCHGTGIMTVGDSVYTATASKHCPVCKSKGYVKCQFCRGTGSRAKWLGPIPETPPSTP